MHSVKLVTVKSGQYRNHYDDEELLVRCAVFVKAAKTTNDFFRWINDKWVCGTSTGYHGYLGQGHDI